MSTSSAYSAVLLAAFALASCSVIEQSSVHGFTDGWYQARPAGQPPTKLYLSVSDSAIAMFKADSAGQLRPQDQSLPLLYAPPANQQAWRFSKTSLDIDITSILLKYRPGTAGRSSELTTDFNAALYAGWRKDYFNYVKHEDPLGNKPWTVTGRGFDVGIFAGLGTATVNSFTTDGQVTDEYSGLSLQTGLAAFLETKLVSFGLALGIDWLTGSHHQYWIYQQKPWLGFVIGVALN